LHPRGKNKVASGANTCTISARSKKRAVTGFLAFSWRGSELMKNHGA
jgi:hypothetical protein